MTQNIERVAWSVEYFSSDIEEADVAFMEVLSHKAGINYVTTDRHLGFLRGVEVQCFEAAGDIQDDRSGVVQFGWSRSMVGRVEITGRTPLASRTVGHDKIRVAAGKVRQATEVAATGSHNAQVLLG